MIDPPEEAVDPVSVTASEMLPPALTEDADNVVVTTGVFWRLMPTESPNGKPTPVNVPVIVFDAVSMTAMLPFPFPNVETKAVAPVPLSAIATGPASPEIVLVTVLVAVEITETVSETEAVT
jgi:hypothetical protein